MTSLTTQIRLNSMMITFILYPSSPFCFSVFFLSQSCSLLHSSHLCFLRGPPQCCTPPFCSFLQRPSPSHQFLKYTPLCNSLLGALNLSLFSTHIQFLFPPRSLTKLIPLTLSKAFPRLHKHTHASKCVMVLKGTSSSLLLSPHICPSILSLSLSLGEQGKLKVG